MKSKVVIVKCENYDSKNVDLAVRHAFELLGGIEKYVKSSDRILLKPNLLGAFAPEKGVTTHPEIVRALIRIVKEKNATPYVGDSHGGGLSENIDNVLKKTGISKLCDEEKCEIVNFESAGVKRIKATNQNNRKVPVLELTKAVFDFNSVFSIAKMKTHSLMVITGAIKNLYGCVPGLSKTYYHLLATHPQDFAEMLADILSIVKPRLGIIDGITTMEGEGPTYGKLKHLGIIMVSDDLVALDTVMAKIMGLNPKKDPVIRATVRCGLGIGDIENIEILGEKIEDVIPEKFELPPNSKIRLIPRWLGPLVKKFLWTKPKILQENCTLCQKCLKSCPAQIITVIDKKITIDKSKCIGCMCCYELCPSGAVAIEYSILAKIFFSRGKIIASIRNIIEYSLCLVLEGIVLLLPRRTALLLGALLSNTARVCLASREKLVRKNLSLTFPDKNDSEINTIAGNVWKNFGFGLAEFIKIKQTDKKNYIKYAEFDESEINFREAFKDKKGVILLTAHFGNWEMMGASLLFRGYKIMTIARNLRNPYGNRAIAKMREIGGGRTVEEHQAVRESLRWLRAGNCLAIIIDQHITEGGVIVDFLGRPAYTTPIITLLAKKTGAKIVPVYNLRTQPGKIRIFAEKVVELISTSDNKQDLMVNTENFNKIIGKWILKNPEQWFWLHNRWKVK
ncbi:MAG: hypothetical protein COY53_10185 [Elusimicrobia bacterium CG_4_10_14_0_8_um_filter_37_32]|nr:MAG: hypothetical protein COS17_09490 [Elusimicrobia bacterium CG02_land_8_20_14_3_00_37_13]PIZ12411.1 MAG: hypothetical protein COY53_10185 [Elusimicrobia bacterium CG_4_10_14_0_8_um_filter_37_32]